MGTPVYDTRRSPARVARLSRPEPAAQGNLPRLLLPALSGENGEERWVFRSAHPTGPAVPFSPSHLFTRALFHLGRGLRETPPEGSNSRCSPRVAGSTTVLERERAGVACQRPDPVIRRNQGGRRMKRSVSQSRPRRGAAVRVSPRPRRACARVGRATRQRVRSKRPKRRSAPARSGTETAVDFERLLADEGMPAELPSIARRWRSPRSPGCVSSRMRPTTDVGLSELSLNGLTTWDDQIRHMLPGTRRTGRTATNMERARDVLWSQTLPPTARKAWSMYCDGASEATIARATRRSREFLRDHFLGPLKTICGIRTQPFTQRGRINARKRSASIAASEGHRKSSRPERRSRSTRT